MAPALSKKVSRSRCGRFRLHAQGAESIFATDEQLTVIGHAKDGREAIALAESLKPDVITMDLNMPHMDGLQATAQIMTTNPRPIVM